MAEHEQTFHELVDGLRAHLPETAFQATALGLVVGRDDYVDLLSEALLDGGDDKKIDLFLIDQDSGRAIIAQAVENPSWPEKEPPANKASDLNTALAWLFDAELTQIAREDIRAKAHELRDAIADGTVHTVEVYYIHNYPESKNSDTEMGTVEANLKNTLSRVTSRDGGPINGVARQIGRERAAAAFADQNAVILVQDEVDFPIEVEAQAVAGGTWEALVAPVSGKTLADLVEAYGEKLFGPNIRGFLGTRNRRANINNQIKATAANQPDNFWVFNNGVTFVTLHASVHEHEDGSKSIRCKGLGVTNGAQTLGSLGEAAAKDKATLDGVFVQARFVQSANALIDDIIRYNNTQNPIRPWELRVHDETQARLEREFKEKFGLNYVTRRGGGRGSSLDIHIASVAPRLAAFHGDPNTAHRNSPMLFDDEVKYREIFGQHTDAAHLLFVTRIGEAIAAIRDDLRVRHRDGTATEDEKVLHGYFRFSAFTYALLYLIAKAYVQVTGQGEGVKVRLALSDELQADREKAIEALKKTVLFVLQPLPRSLGEKVPYDVFRSEAELDVLATQIQQIVGSLAALQPQAVSVVTDCVRVR